MEQVPFVGRVVFTCTDVLIGREVPMGRVVFVGYVAFGKVKLVYIGLGRFSVGAPDAVG
jgi:hypothetical protein